MDLQLVDLRIDLTQLTVLSASAEQIAEKASGNVQIPGEGEEKQITVAGVEVKTKSASTYNTSVPHIDERVAPTTPSEVSASISVNHSVDIKT